MKYLIFLVVLSMPLTTYSQNLESPISVNEEDKECYYMTTPGTTYEGLSYKGGMFLEAEFGQDQRRRSEVCFKLLQIWVGERQGQTGEFGYQDWQSGFKRTCHFRVKNKVNPQVGNILEYIMLTPQQTVRKIKAYGAELDHSVEMDCESYST